ncbi:MAG TPA: hypothetical protein DER23_07410 [Clostridiales bacterium]|jgi:hypothetical protein|nr:hypothetical protein [Clostridiales bacterium]
MNNKRIIAYAKEQGYETAVYLKQWKDYDVYEPVYDSSCAACIGVPLVILVKGDEIRISTVDEAFEHLETTEKT